jgi:hypothetical protein
MSDDAYIRSSFMSFLALSEHLSQSRFQSIIYNVTLVSFGVSVKYVHSEEMFDNCFKNFYSIMFLARFSATTHFELSPSGSTV